MRWFGVGSTAPALRGGASIGLICCALGCGGGGHSSVDTHGDAAVAGTGGHATSGSGAGGAGGSGMVNGGAHDAGTTHDAGHAPGAGGGGAGGSGGHVDAGHMTTHDAGGDHDASADAASMHAGGGSAAAHVCKSGQSYGDPLAGMGAIMSIKAPSGSTFSFLEGPVWVASLSTLFFSDNAASPAERIWKLAPPSTTPELFLDNAGANGMAVDNDDQLVVCNQGTQAMTRIDPQNGNATPIVDVYMGKKFNSPNDTIVHSNGTIYFTDPPHGLKGRTAELDFNGIFRIAPSGELSRIEGWTTDRNPNGIVLSADEHTLFVSEDNAAKVWKIALGDDGAPLSASATFTATSMTPDGMAVDCAGNLYVATQNGIEVFDPSGATKLGTVPQAGSNCTFGGADRQTLYITHNDTLYYVHLAVPGLPD